MGVNKTAGLLRGHKTPLIPVKLGSSLLTRVQTLKNMKNIVSALSIVCSLPQLIHCNSVVVSCTEVRG